MRDIVAMQRDAAVIDAGQARDRTQQGAFAATARAEQDVKLALTDFQRNVVDYW